MLREIIFQVDYGGLGDHLFYSALPRLLKKNGLADKVFLSNKSNFRNPQIYDFVWKSNPFLDGLTENIPDILPPQGREDNSNIINLIFGKFGISSENEIEMDIYTEVKDNIHLNNKYIDLNYISYIGAFSWLDKIRVYQKYPDHIIINPSRITSLLFSCRNKVQTKSLSHYAEIIKNSSSFVTLASGGATLAAALNRPSVVYYGFGQNRIFHHALHLYTRVGGEGFLRRRLARFYEKRNARRIKKSILK